MVRAYQINGKTVAIFSAIYMVRLTRTVFVNRRFVRDVFERLCERVEEKATRSLFASRATSFSSTVRPYLVDGTAIFVN